MSDAGRKAPLSIGLPLLCDCVFGESFVCVCVCVCVCVLGYSPFDLFTLAGAFANVNNFMALSV